MGPGARVTRMTEPIGQQYARPRRRSRDWTDTSVRIRSYLRRVRVRGVVCVLLLTSVVLALSTKGITDEGVVCLQPDSARHLMNGVFLHDAFRDLPLSRPLDYAYKYYARYPALSIGHHSLLLALAEVPFFALFGISVCSARLAVVLFMLICGIGWFFLARAVYGDLVALFASLLLVTTPFVVSFSRVVMSEIPTMGLIILACYFFYQYCLHLRSRHAYAFVISLALSIYARQQALFMIPIFLCYFALTMGARRLVSRQVLIACLIGAVLLLPLVPITLELSRTNVRMVLSGSLPSRFDPHAVFYYAKVVWGSLLTPPVVLLGLLGGIASLGRRDNRAILFLLWIPGYYLLLSLAQAFSPRYAIYLIPPFCLLAAATLEAFRSRPWKVLISTLMAVTVVYQFVFAFGLEPVRAEGYEEAARYILEHRKGESVLYSSDVDAGHFIFFLRKHAPRPDLVVLRADKLLVCPSVRGVLEERVRSREEIYDLLRRLGTGYVVMEEKVLGPRLLEPQDGLVGSDGSGVRKRILSRPHTEDLQGVTLVLKTTRPRPLQWLRDDLNSDNFILRKVIPISSNGSELQNAVLAVYEYRGYAGPDHQTSLRMNLHPMGRSLEIRFEDLLSEEVGR